jgi:hypothetical protein
MYMWGLASLQSGHWAMLNAPPPVVCSAWWAEAIACPPRPNSSDGLLTKVIMPNYWFNVSTIGVDAILGTQPELAEVPTSKTCLSLDQSREAASNGPESDGSANLSMSGADYESRS